MAQIAPAILAKDPHEFREQMERIEPFAKRIQIDLTDGQFASSQTVGLNQVWWPDHIKADLHLMYKQPESSIDILLKLKPHLVIVHAEADGNFMAIAEKLHKHNIKVGVALLPKTHPKVIVPALAHIDHVLIFSGHLGHYGGKAALNLVKKAQVLSQHKHHFEIGWDGGVNLSNAHYLAKHGIDVLNVGGFIQHSPAPGDAYAKLESAVKGA
jgi:ribulose-phosphate 3-epimerase